MLDTCIILNGPPGSGKDTIADGIAQAKRSKYVKMQFKDQLYFDTAVYFGVDVYEFVQQATDRLLKEQPWDKLKNLKAPKELNLCYSPREAMIHVSEEIMKPYHGDTYFGKAAVCACERANAQFAVFADGGFSSEIKPMSEAFKHLYIIRLQRDGFSFENDSRNYIEGFPNTYDLELHDGDPESAIQTILNLVKADRKQAA